MKLLTISTSSSTPKALLAGVCSKPPVCKAICPSYSVGEGFVEDHLPPNAKILLMIQSPSSDDLVSRKLLSGKAGWSFFKNYIAPLGYTQEDYGVCALVRCRPKGGKMLLGRDKKATIESCRYFDQGVIKTFNPDCYIITQSLRDVYQEGAFHTLMQRDIAKAFEFAARGMRPIVLQGQECAEIIAPYIVGQGGCKKFRGHWQEIPVWPFLSARKDEPVKSGFTPARGFNGR